MTTKKMSHMERLDVITSQNYLVVKSNDLVRKARYNLTVQEQKTLSYIISMIKPEDTVLQEYTFDIVKYCKTCEIDWDSGKNYENVKESLKRLRDRSFWMQLEDGTETLCSWINKVYVNKRSGIVRVRLDDDLAKYLIDLRSQFTKYELVNTLKMQSQYSFRIYELLKSYSFARTKTFDIDELKHILMAENYVNFKDFRNRVLDVAMKEINEYTDIKVSYDAIVERGRKVSKLQFIIKKNKKLLNYAEIVNDYTNVGMVAEHKEEYQL